MAPTAKSQNLDTLILQMFTKYKILKYQGNFSKSVATRLGSFLWEPHPHLKPHHTEIYFAYGRGPQNIYAIQHLKCCPVYLILMAKVGPRPTWDLHQSTVVTPG